MKKKTEFDKNDKQSLKNSFTAEQDPAESPKQNSAQLGKLDNKPGTQSSNTVPSTSINSYNTKILRTGFDKNFTRVSTKQDLFFEVYDRFLEAKQRRKEWKPSTVKRLGAT